MGKKKTMKVTVDWMEGLLELSEKAHKDIEPLNEKDIVPISVNMLIGYTSVIEDFLKDLK